MIIPKKQFIVSITLPTRFPLLIFVFPIVIKNVLPLISSLTQYSWERMLLASQFSWSLPFRSQLVLGQFLMGGSHTLCTCSAHHKALLVGNTHSNSFGNLSACICTLFYGVMTHKFHLSPPPLLQMPKDSLIESHLWLTELESLNLQHYCNRRIHILYYKQNLQRSIHNTSSSTWIFCNYIS